MPDAVTRRPPAQCVDGQPDHRQPDIHAGLEVIGRQRSPKRDDVPVARRFTPHERREQVHRQLARRVCPDERVRGVLQEQRAGKRPRGDRGDRQEAKSCGPERSAHQEQRISPLPRGPAVEDRPGDDAVGKVVEVAERDQAQRCSSGGPSACSRRLAEPDPEQQEQRNPFERDELQVTARVSHMEAREGEHAAADETARVRSRHRAAQPECRQPSKDEREDDDEVVGLDEREHLEQPDRQQAVERIERVAEQRRSERVMQQRRMPGQSQLAGAPIDPPQVPDVLKPIRSAEQEMRRELRDDQRVEGEEGRQVEGRRNPERRDSASHRLID